MKGHTRNPGYIPGDHWVECDVCGFEYRQSVMRERWDNLVVCPADYEVRHPQDFVRGVEDNQAAQGIVNSPTEQTFVTGICTTRSVIAGRAIAGCAIIGFEDNYSQVPTSTFTI